MAREGNEEGTSDIKPLHWRKSGRRMWEIRRWSDDGLVRFNELIALVKKDQTTMKRGTST
jgi:hypothetical protein